MFTLKKGFTAQDFKKYCFQNFQDMSAYNDKKGVFVVFNHDVGEAVVTMIKRAEGSEGGSSKVTCV